ncbi:hypothetical protein G3O00_16815 [Burkholderia sp. Ac-20384]|uniref:TnsA endonuclease N-terminal domain-containing protein n=1 Tax=Burkholderia sp. Ac-20384 TaxID=2703902 RepID=UPI00197F162A|nr:TnsA endonuclease N-terminal domain-containing protein [Burkholderia sp. Ac-20384]MBN3825270.1 hypothetical protein [Burkholderia sp. Ac-20384]
MEGIIMSDAREVHTNPNKPVRARGLDPQWEEGRLSQKNRDRYIKEGRGTGEMSTYVPGRTLSELRGIGRLHRFCCSRCGGRQVVLASDLILSTFLKRHWDRRTQELREYYPVLDVDETARIARFLGVKHPTYRDRSPCILITDLMVSKIDSRGCKWVAIESVSVCRRSIEASVKRLILEEYWRRRGIPLRTEYSAGLNDFYARNLWQLFGISEQLLAYGLGERERIVQEAVSRRLRCCSYTWILDACFYVASECDFTRAECVRAALQLIASRRIACPLDVPLLLNQPASSVRISSGQQEIRHRFPGRESDCAKNVRATWQGARGISTERRIPDNDALSNWEASSSTSRELIPDRR